MAADDKTSANSAENTANSTEATPGKPVSTELSLGHIAAELASMLRELLKVEVRVEPEVEIEQDHAQFMSSLERPACCWVVGSPEGPANLLLSGPALPVAVDCLLGGDGQAPRSRMELTSVEQRVLGRLAVRTAEAIGQLAGTTFGLKPESSKQLSRCPDQPEMPQRGQQTPLVTVSFRVSLSGQRGAISLCLPAELGQRLLAGPRFEGDSGQALTPPRTSQAAAVELSVVADAADLPTEHLADLSPGDVLVTDADCEGELEVRIDGKPSHTAKLGSRNGKRAVTIVRPLDEI